MARRNPSISPILSARGYGARVLWPKYTPDGGVNSGSEIPVPPRNTLQSNQSNLIYHENPFTPVTKDAPGRIAVTSKRGKTLYMTENQIRKMGSKMLAEGEIERALGRSNPMGRNNPRSKRSGKREGKPLGAFAAFEERVKREMAEAGEYPESDLRSNPNASYERLTPAQLAEGKERIQKLLDGGMSHADVRKKFDLSYPLYMTILRSGRTKGSQPVHRGAAHLLRNPW